MPRLDAAHASAWRRQRPPKASSRRRAASERSVPSEGQQSWRASCFLASRVLWYERQTGVFVWLSLLPPNVPVLVSGEGSRSPATHALPNSAPRGVSKLVYLSDKTLTCRDCGVDFVFTAGEQEFYASRGFTNEPARCPRCRQARRAQREGRDGGLAGDQPAVGRSAGRTLHEATCAECGQPAMVPFVPRGDRPVYCSSCFERVRSYQ